MRVAFVSTMEGLPWGGSELLWSQTAARLRRQGVAVAVSTRRWPRLPGPVEELQSLGCSTYLRTVPTPRPIRALRRLGLARHHAWRWLRQFRPDLVVVSLGIHLEGAEVTRACRKYGINYALLVQSADESRWPEDAYLDALRESYEGAMACYFISTHNRRIVETQLATELANARAIRNPCNVRYDTLLPWPGDRAKPRFACVGTLAPVQKAQDLLLRLFAQEPWRSRAEVLSFYGTGQNETSLKRLAQLYRVDQAAFCGYCADVERIWASHHALLLPSRHEGMPIVTVEAMLCGRVCVVTDVGSNSELIEDGRTGFLVPAPTLPLLAETMERAWQRRAEWSQIGAEAAESVRRLVPRDPVGVFVASLRSLLGEAAPTTGEMSYVLA